MSNLKVGVLTWHKVVNHGAVLQAFASQKVLEKMGNKCLMLDYKADHSGHMDKAILKRARIILSRMSYSGVRTKLKLRQWDNDKREAFSEFRKQEMILGDHYAIEQNLDAVLIGSDMVFDFYTGYNPFMYGKEVKAPYKFSYAACFGYVTEELFDTFQMKSEIVNLINSLNGISYRDDNTGLLLENKCGVKIAFKTIDPVLLYGFDEEKEKWDSGKWYNRNYLLLYSYTYNMDKPSESNSICRFAKEEGLKIVSLGYIHQWCDECVNADPKEFLELFLYAKYVVTDTFHGTVFSLLFGKQFCTFVRNNAFKVRDLMKEFGLEDRIKSDIVKCLYHMKHERLDNEQVKIRLEELRAGSMEYLKNQLNEAKND